MAARSALLFVLALTGSLSCGSRVTAPPPPTVDIRLELTTSGNAIPGEPVNIQAVIRNAGGVAVDVLDACPEPYIRIYDRQSNPLPQRDPTIPIGGCPASMPAPWFAPGSRLEVSLKFDGGYYAANGEHLDAPPGTYFAVATIHYSDPPDGQLKTVTRDVVFTWR